MDTRQTELAQLEKQIREAQKRQADLIKLDEQRRAQASLELENACFARNIPRIEELLKAGVRGNMERAIKQACKNNDVELASLLLNTGFSANLQAELREACQKGQLELVKLLLAHDVDIDCSEGYYYAAIFCKDRDNKPSHYAGDAIYNAIKGDHPEILELLINKAASILQNKIKKYNKDKEDHYSDDKIVCPTLDVLASQIANVLDAKAYRRETGLALVRDRQQSLLIEAIMTKSSKCAKLLATKFKETKYSRVMRYTFDECEPGSKYCNRSDLEANTIVIKQTREKQYQEWLSTWTVFWQEETSSRWSITSKALPDTAIPDIAAAAKTIKSEREEYDRYGSPSKAESYDAALIEKITATFKCARKNPLFLYYHWSGGEWPTETIQGTALGLAIDRGCDDIARFLIELGCHIEEKHGNGLSEHYSHSLGWDGGSRYMDWDGERDLTPLLLAVKKNNRDLVQLLVEHGADLSVKDRAGKTALGLTQDAEIIKLLSTTNTFVGRLSRLKNPTPIPPWFCCSLTGKPLEDPLCIEGELYERSAYMQKDKVVATSAKTVQAVVRAIEAHVSKQEEAERLGAEKQTPNKLGMYR